MRQNAQISAGKLTQETTSSYNLRVLMKIRISSREFLHVTTTSTNQILDAAMDAQGPAVDEMRSWDSVFTNGREKYSGNFETT